MDSDNLLLQKIGEGLPLTVFFPGWATDFRVFDDMDLPTNRLFPLEPFSESIHDTLAHYLCTNGLIPVILAGWSLGGFIAAEFARQFPGMVRQLVLCGVRLRYPPEQIEATRHSVLNDRERFLTSFYRQCFLPAQKEDYHRLRDTVLSRYMSEMNTDHLLTSLDCLAQVEMSKDRLPGCPICIIHGDQDLIAPVHEAAAIAEGVDNAQLHIIPNAGHAAFLTEESKEIIQECLR